MWQQLLIIFQDSPWFFYIIVGILGLIVGSFLNVVIYRLPIMVENTWKKQCHELLAIEQPNLLKPSFNLVWPSSHCPTCNHVIRVYENIPILSYLFLKGKCAHCNTGISMRYPLIEGLSAIFTLLAAWQFGPTLVLVPVLIFTWSMLVLAVIDFNTQYLYDDITLPILWLGLLCNIFGMFTDLPSAIIGAMTGYLSLWSIFHLFKMVTGKEGMGAGDFKLFAAFGAWMGWQALPIIILLSSVVGAVLGSIFLLTQQKDRNTLIPFGPFLAGAGWLTLVWQTEVLNLYYRWLGFSG